MNWTEQDRHMDIFYFIFLLFFLACVLCFVVCVQYFIQLENSFAFIKPKMLYGMINSLREILWHCCFHKSWIKRNLYGRRMKSYTQPSEHRGAKVIIRNPPRQIDRQPRIRSNNTPSNKQSSCITGIPCGDCCFFSISFLFTFFHIEKWTK